MQDEPEFLARLERAEPEEFADILEHASAEEERALRTYFGDARYDRLRRAGHKRVATRATAQGKKGNVVVLPGIMGSELTRYETDADVEPIWLNYWKLIRGGFTKLRLDDSDDRLRVRPTGILKRYYGEQLLWLMRSGWRVRAFWYDWRTAIDESAGLLATRITEWFPNEPVHLIAHSMGGLVARAFIKGHPKLWSSMLDEKGGGRAGGRLLMLGTPNHGSFAIPQLFTGLNSTFRILVAADVFHRKEELQDVVATFDGAYQMLPSESAVSQVERLYLEDTYRPLRVSRRRLEEARSFHKRLEGVVDPDRMVYVAGTGQVTAVGIRDWDQLDSFDGYSLTREGDGTVPHSLGRLTNNGSAVPMYFVDEEHGNLPGNDDVLGSTDQILMTGRCEQLPSEPGSRVRGEEGHKAQDEMRRELRQRHQDEEAAFRELSTFYRAKARSASPAVDEGYTERTRYLEDLAVRGFLGGESTIERDSQTSPGDGDMETGKEGDRKNKDRSESIRLRLKIVTGGIQDDSWMSKVEPPVDAIAVGHYIGIRPENAEGALDVALSASFAKEAKNDPHDLVLTKMADRGVLRGELGYPYIVPDSRASAVGRDLVIMGMGYPGRCGIPELALLVRELCLTLGQLHKKHLATVLIGAGTSNLPLKRAAEAWLEGLQQAISASARDVRQLECITFVEIDPNNAADLEALLTNFLSVSTQDSGSSLSFELLPSETLTAKADKMSARSAHSTRTPAVARDEVTRITVEFDEKGYRFGAVAQNASMPLRVVTIDPDLVREANDELLTSNNSPLSKSNVDRLRRNQKRSGRFLSQLLFPKEFLGELASSDPLVLTCDNNCARIHWEMVAQPTLTSVNGTADTSDAFFLGLARGLTRQLKTVFASPFQGPPVERSGLRVLIVGDPAGDDPLEGARDEAWLVADLFEQLKDKGLSVDIVSLIGPNEATRTRVLRELFETRYDILHYCGHAAYDDDDASNSGWVFTGGKRLRAWEFERLDRVPPFVFANACESGITPDRADKRHANMAPSLAESFFRQGVENFVCSGWPVNDRAARLFAETFYRSLLGLAQGSPPQPIYLALQDARKAVFKSEDGVGTWGAYQHYGNPWFRLLRK